MDVISLIVGCLGFAASIASYFKVQSARETAKLVVARFAAQEEYGRLCDLIKKLRIAKEVARSRRPNAPKHLAAGRTVKWDLFVLSEAEDALRTGLPLDLNEEHVALLVRAADELREVITNESRGDVWCVAFSIFQFVIPRLEQLDRNIRNDELRYFKIE